MSKRDRVLTVDEIEELISYGNVIVIYDQCVLKLNGWIERHPGGDKAVFHMIGRDATDEMNAYHCDETVSTFKRYKIGAIDHKWINLLPPIQGGVFKTIEQKRFEKSQNVNVSIDIKVDGGFTRDTNADKANGNVKSCDIKNRKAVGTAPAGITSKVPNGVILSHENRQGLYPIRKGPVRDPEEVIENYDNQMVKDDLESWPPLDYETQRELSTKYNELHKIVIDAGLYQCPYIEYFKQFCRCLGLFMYFLTFYKIHWYTLSAICLGFCWQQLTFIAHDAGHIAITHNYQVDNIIGIIVADFIGGLSLGWWKRNHNVHHLITNDPVHDPDIQHLPFFAITPKFFTNVFSTYYDTTLWFDVFAKKFIRFQRYTYYAILSLARFNLYALSWTYLLKNQGPKKGKSAWFRYFELCGLSFFFYWYFYVTLGGVEGGKGQKIKFLLVSHISSFMVHVQITLSHFAMSTSDLGTSESFVARQLRTTMDVDCPEWFDYFHGGLQFQAIHHLFPRMPRHNFRKAQKYVLEFCEETGLKYSIYGFQEGNARVLNRLEDVGKQLKIFTDCLKGMNLEAMESKNLYEKRVDSVLKETEAKSD